MAQPLQKQVRRRKNSAHQRNYGRDLPFEQGSQKSFHHLLHELSEIQRSFPELGPGKPGPAEVQQIFGDPQFVEKVLTPSFIYPIVSSPEDFAAIVGVCGA